MAMTQLRGVLICQQCYRGSLKKRGWFKRKVRITDMELEVNFINCLTFWKDGSVIINFFLDLLLH